MCVYVNGVCVCTWCVCVYMAGCVCVHGGACVCVNGVCVYMVGHVCMCVCVKGGACVCVNGVCVCVHGGACVCVCVCTWLGACMCVCVNDCVCVNGVCVYMVGHVCVYVCVCMVGHVCVCVYMVGGVCVYMVWGGVSAGVGSEGIASPHWPGAGHWGEGAGPTGGEGVDKGTLAPPSGQAPALATQKARWRREPSPSPPACLPTKPQDP